MVKVLNSLAEIQEENPKFIHWNPNIFWGIEFRWIRKWTFNVCYERISTVSETCCFTWRSLSRWLLKELWRRGSRRDWGRAHSGERETIWDIYNHISDRDRDKNCFWKKCEKTRENAIYLQWLVFRVRAK